MTEELGCRIATAVHIASIHGTASACERLRWHALRNRSKPIRSTRHTRLSQTYIAGATLNHGDILLELDPGNTAATLDRIPGRIAAINLAGVDVTNQSPDTGSNANSVEPAGAGTARPGYGLHPNSNLLQAARAAMLAHHAPPYLVLDEQFVILDLSESAGRLLGISKAGGSITGLADGSLATTLRLAAGSAMADGCPISLRDISIPGSEAPGSKAPESKAPVSKAGGRAVTRRFDLQAEPVEIEGRRGALILLRDATDGPHADPGDEVDAFLMRLLRDTDVPIATLDRSLHLRSLTAAARGTLGVVEGEALPRDVLGGGGDPTLLRDLSRVLADGRQIERSIRAGTGQSCRATLIQIPAFGSGGGDGSADAGGGVAIRFEPVPDRGAAFPWNDAVAEELNHRLANILGTATALATLMLDRTVSLQDFRTAFTRRLQALTGVNALVARDNWRGTELSLVLEQQIERRMYRMPHNIRLDGPNCRLLPRAAVTLGMAVDEMIANAATHGAFARPGMAVSLSWSRAVDDNGDAILAIDWIESGDHRIGADTGKGLGCLLIERGIAHELSGRVGIDFTGSGIRYRIEIPEGEALVDARQAQ